MVTIGPLAPCRRLAAAQRPPAHPSATRSGRATASWPPPSPSSPRDGFAGARVARIARRARVNKRMLYHYFGNKEDLFREIFDRKLRERAGWITEAPAGLGDEPRVTGSRWPARTATGSASSSGRRSGSGTGPVIREAERQASLARALDDLRDRQRRGLLPGTWTRATCCWPSSGPIAYPLAFPQVTRMVTGRASSDPVFHKERAAFLRSFSDALS